MICILIHLVCFLQLTTIIISQTTCNNICSNKMKVAVVGATGGLGREIVRQSLKRGYEVVAAVRDQAKATAMFAGQAVKIAQVNIDGGEGLKEAFAGVDCVLEVISNGEWRWIVAVKLKDD